MSTETSRPRIGYTLALGFSGIAIAHLFTPPVEERWRYVLIAAVIGAVLGFAVDRLREPAD